MITASSSTSLFTKIPMFNGLSPEIVSKLESTSKICYYKKKEIIASQGDQISNTIIVKKGMINLVFTNNNYEDVFYTTLSKHDPLGIFEIFFGQNYSYSAKALTDCEVYEIPSQCFLQIVEQCHQLQLNINLEIAELLKRSYEIIRDSNFRIEKKIMNTILFLAEEFGYVKSNTVEIKHAPTQSEIALMAGTTRETISRTFSALQKNERIKIDRSSIVIPDYENFKRFSEKIN
ncbi:MAG: Crp/Fnr family transcriptional regulator [Ignavibacteria bacterium]|nr:MAG: Crp/Fnr family transcriptional regulator [Ignavibacteria bacterium]KAF0155890.1 MAG: Crp/Fnr family transcriptional regulator [Ignavibacteria bacterium]